MFANDDTIVAISSAAGSAPRAIVRLSGPQAVALASEVLASAAIEEVPGFRSAAAVAVLGPHGPQLPARVYVFRAPRSYTRQDVVELHIPGAAAAAAALAAQLVQAGARRAEPGEFTARALLSGRIDLSAAEAVADVVNAADDAQLRSAVSVLQGRVFNLCKESSIALTEVLACVEASIDLADEDITLDQPLRLAEHLDALSGHLRHTADEAADIPDSAECPHAVLTGRPNVGKSSLLNALTATPRAIVSALAGTTRDVLSAPMTVGGVGVMMQDAAGFSAACGPVEAAADSAARRAVAAADVVLLVVDLTGEDGAEDRLLLDEIRATNPRAPLLLLANKADLRGAGDESPQLVELSRRAGANAIATSAVTGQGLDAVKAALADRLNLGAARSGQALGLHQRQKRCLLAAVEASARSAGLLAPAAEIIDVAELVAIELREALAELGQISGQVVTEDVLGAIFERFCVGK